MASTETETTMTMTTPDGKSTGSVPLSQIEDAASRVKGQLSLFEGQRYPDAEIKLSGGVKGLTVDLEDFASLKVGDDFTATIHGVVASKRHAVKFDEDGNPERTLTVTLKADNVRAA